ncbi:MAG: flagellar export protein FliJ [Hyphomicrobiales bacterium]|jgi:flagellar export protein FliJ|nr:MAG: flagellar export protein FliJ [Hyphomicrobiales bacterium]
MRPRDTMLRLHRFRTEEKRRQVADIEGMINDFMRKYDDLDAAVKFEESRNGVSDPTHFNYSLQAKAARARRDNLMKSIAELKDQLTDARAALDEAEQELRRAELLIEKEGAAAVAVAAQVMAAPHHVR